MLVCHVKHSSRDFKFSLLLYDDSKSENLTMVKALINRETLASLNSKTWQLSKKKKKKIPSFIIIYVGSRYLGACTIVFLESGKIQMSKTIKFPLTYKCYDQKWPQISSWGILNERITHVHVACAACLFTQITCWYKRTDTSTDQCFCDLMLAHHSKVVTLHINNSWNHL